MDWPVAFFLSVVTMCATIVVCARYGKNALFEYNTATWMPRVCKSCGKEGKKR